ncbi:MAG: hypothetical protein HUU35_17785, partial [Armatimonadetes bacterium]|nr:hypothetical protein [Armatimonadota bacterium]
MGAKRRVTAEPAPRRRLDIHFADLALFLAALLLPLWGSGMPLDEVPVPGTMAGRFGLALLFTTALLSCRPAPR